MIRKFFFRESSEVFNEVTAIFDFLWPTAAAMWNLRWQVGGYLSSCPNASIHEISSRFITGSNIHGANLKRACIELTWEQQQENFAKFLLVNIFALYESYIHSLVKELLPSNSKTKEIEKQLQLPTIYTDGGKTGIWNAIEEITTPESCLMKNGFYLKLLENKKNRKRELDNMMKCYRYFKECRNALIHNGSVAKKITCDKYLEFKSIATKDSLGVSEVPEYFPIVIGEPVRVSLRGVIGLCDIILKIIVTLDAELSRSQYAELVFKKYWEEINKKQYTLKTSDINKRSRQIERLINKIGLPTPISTDGFEEFFRRNALVG